MAAMCDTAPIFELAKHQRNVSTDTSSSHDSWEQEDYDYPLPDWVVIRNGFLDGPTEGPVSSLEGFFKERTVHSCPSSRLAGPRSKVDEVEEDVSRSTSAGSSEAGDADEAQDQVHAEHNTPSQAPMFVQNTFIHFRERPQSLIEFLQERQVRSCPSSRLSESRSPGSGIEAAMMEGYFAATPSHLDFSDVDSEEFDMRWPPASDPALPSEPAMQVAFVPGLVQKFTPVAPVHVLRLDDMLADPALGSSVPAPTIGSMGHNVGKCKPCAFAYTKGCADGWNCKFCHLCEPGEKKRRRKEKLAYRREVTRTRREAAQARQQLGALASYLAEAGVSARS